VRILLAHKNFTIQGGAEVFYHEVGRVLKDNGQTVAYFSCAEDGLVTEYSEYFPASVDYKTGSLLNRVLRLPSIVYNRRSKVAMAKLIEDFKPDVIHAFAVYVGLTPSILEAAHEAGIPVVLSCNDYKHICPNYKLFHHGRVCEECKGGRFYHALRNLCCHRSAVFSAASMVEAYVHERLNIWRKNVSCFLFASKFMADKTEEFWGKGEVQIDYLRNPFDAAKYHVEPNVGQHGLYFGRLIEEKGVDILLEAAALIPEVPVVVVGDGPDRAELEKRAKSLNNVRIVGPAWGDELAQWLYDARAVIVPSLWHENFPYVILQAFAASKPVIGTERGGIPELVHAGPHGWTYEATDAVALAGLLQQVQKMPTSALEDMGAAAKRYVTDEFTDEAIYQRLCEIYERVLK
jgi:glycosyltransferase involved in cell wall biosynthesis